MEQRHLPARKVLDGCRPTYNRELRGQVKKTILSYLAELHDQVHKRARRISISDIRSLLEEVRDRNIGEKGLVQ